jgi:probable rRNA maturation factor
MIEVEVFGAQPGTRLEDQRGSEGPDSRRRLARLRDRLLGWRGRRAAREAPSLAEIRRLCILAAASAGIKDGHLAVEFVDAQRIAKLNAEHRAQRGPTDVLSFPIDGVEPIPEAAPIADSEVGAGAVAGVHPPAAIDSGGRELGDVVICAEHTADVREAVVHGVLHLMGMDHETDDGEMLALQRHLLARENQ